jgi:hypothetical protein
MVRTLADSAMLFEAMAGPAPLDTRVAGKIPHSSQSVEVRTDAWFILALPHCLSTQSAIAVAGRALLFNSLHEGAHISAHQPAYSVGAL